MRGLTDSQYRRLERDTLQVEFILPALGICSALMFAVIAAVGLLLCPSYSYSQCDVTTVNRPGYTGECFS